MAEISSTIAAANKGSDKKEDMVLLLSPDTNWARFLTPAPFAISLLGELMLISSDTDFSLCDNAPVDGFKFLRYPSSFRACLVQISNDGWSAFNEAHTNMDQIRLYSAGVEEHVRSAVKILLAGTKDEITHILPISLGRVSDIADTCKDLAECIEKKFDRVMDVTGELLEVSTSAQGTYDKKYKETVAALEAAKLQKEKMSSDQEEMRKRCEMLEKDMKKAHEDFNSAMKEVPSGGGMLGLSLAEGMVNGVRGLCSLFSNEPSTTNYTLSQSRDYKADAKKRRSNVDEINKGRAYSKAFELKIWIDELFALASGGMKNGEQYPDLQAIKDNKVNIVSASLQNFKSSFQNSETKTSPEQTILKISMKGIGICQRLESLVASLTGDSNGKIGKKIGKDAKCLLKEAGKFEAKAKQKTATSVIDEQSHNLRNCSIEQTSSIVQATNENARFKVETAKHILTDARDRHERAFAEMKKESEELHKVIREMAALNPKKVDFETIRKMLVRGIQALGDLREQWGRLVRFFQSMSNLIKCSLHTTLHSFVDTASQRKELTIRGLPISKVFIDMLIDQASQANRIAFAVQTIAGTYVEVSDKHLMDRISGLAKLIALDGGDSKDSTSKIETERAKLHSGTKDAQDAITRLMTQHRKDYERRIEERKRRLENEIEAVLPPISTAKLQEIQETVSDGIAKSDEALNKELDNIV